MLSNLASNQSLPTIANTIPHDESASLFEDSKEPFTTEQSKSQLDSGKNNASNELMKMLRDHDAVLKNLRNDVNQLKDKSKVQDDNHNKLNSNFDKYKQQTDKTIDEIKNLLKDHADRLTASEGSITLLKALGSTGGGGKGSDGDNKGLIEILEQLTDKLKKDIHNNFVQKSNFENLIRRIDDLADHSKDLDKKHDNHETSITQCRDLSDQNNLDIQDLKKKVKSNSNSSNLNDNSTGILPNTNSNNDSVINEILNRLKFMERELENKVDMEVFDNEIAGLKALIGNIDEGVNNDLGNLKDQVTKLQSKVDKHTNDIANLFEFLNDIKNTPPQVVNTGGPSTNDILLLRNRMEYVESVLSQYKKTINELNKKLDDFMNEANKKLGAVDESVIRRLQDELNRLRNEFIGYRDDNDNNIKNIFEQLLNKADKDELQKLENRIMEKLNEMLQKFLGMFADKKDTVKRLTNLEKNVKTIFDLMMSKNSPRQNEDDAMFTKKPLNGLTCASCERNIINLSGQIADYHPWKKLPFREPNDRISRYGPGFSKILAMMKPEPSIDNSRADQTQIRAGSTQNDTSFFNHSQTIHEHMINVEMPQNINVSAKNSARTGYQFYTKQNAQFGSRKGSQLRQGATIEDSPPPRENSTDKLPQLNIKVIK
ncbi:UNKNOWN [Stylonychia lemnae]|uniref:Uncharacterized protein n=1 Tax=Stylonychia lemnae TaxID=5949 RepID=A0A078AEP7_STYLE|nr:UNKNOWN [Stylonychia lemnae]|eukprot:CDW80316.1 UNKNOWN [Stylonychia lemnae]